MGSKSDGDWVLNEILWSHVTNFLLHRLILLSLWAKFGHLHSAQFSWVTNVVKGFDLIQVHHVVDHPEVIVVVHGDIKGLHSLRSGTTLANSTLDCEFSLHEGVVFVLNLANDTWGVNTLFIRIPVNWSHTSSAGGGLVVIIKDSLKLRVLFSRGIVIGGLPKSVKPFVSELVY